MLCSLGGVRSRPSRPTRLNGPRRHSCRRYTGRTEDGAIVIVRDGRAIPEAFDRHCRCRQIIRIASGDTDWHRDRSCTRRPLYR